MKAKTNISYYKAQAERYAKTLIVDISCRDFLCIRNNKRCCLLNYQEAA